MSSISEALTKGMRHHQSGQVDEAERLYRQVLEQDPDNAQALHGLGIAALQSRQFAAAAEWIAKAVKIDRSQAAYFANLGECYRHLQRIDDAIDCFNQARQIQPALIRAHKVVGDLETVRGNRDAALEAFLQALRWQPDDAEARRSAGRIFFEQNKLREAEDCFRRVLIDAPPDATGYFDLGTSLHSQGRLEEAAANYRKALEIDPRNTDALNNLAAVLQSQGQFAEAKTTFEALLEVTPEDAVGWLNMAILHEVQGKLAEAVEYYKKSLEVDPKSAIARNGLACLYARRGQIEDAIVHFEQVRQLEPDSAKWAINLGNALQSQGKYEEAVEVFRKAVASEPGLSGAHNNLGAALNLMGRREEAIEAFKRSIELEPNYGVAYSNLGVALQALGRMTESIQAFRDCIERMPEGAPQHSNLLYAINYHPGYDADTILAEHLKWGAMHADPLTLKAAPHTNDRTLDRRLRVGYVSPNFRNQAVNFFSEPLLACHDHKQFEVFCYSDVVRTDNTTQRLMTYADHWRHIVGETDAVVDAMIRQDQIDILVDLTGHIGDNRMLLFARKPAPIQVTYIGYQNTTGMKAMDYRLTDDYSDPPGVTDRLHTETLVRLPKTFYVYLPTSNSPPITPLPALTNGYITFGSFNSFAKVNPLVFETWCKILLAVPNSKLMVLADRNPWLVDYVTEQMKINGVDPSRAYVEDRRGRIEYLKLINTADIALDPFPFNAHTTSLDCLWQGVPVINLSGQTYVTRYGGSGLLSTGLGELIANSRDEYFDVTTRLANDLPRLQELRKNLRPMLIRSPVLDFHTFARNLEAEYRKMWVKWCNGQ